MKSSIFGCIEQGEAAAVDFYNQWVAEVKEKVPPENLLIHEAKEGWEPICKFLGLPVPSNPYPVTNSTAEQEQGIRQRLIMAYMLIVGIPVILSFLIYSLL